jgi:hypothetical protein
VGEIFPQKHRMNVSLSLSRQRRSLAKKNSTSGSKRGRRKGAEGKVLGEKN